MDSRECRGSCKHKGAEAWLAVLHSNPFGLDRYVPEAADNFGSSDKHSGLAFSAFSEWGNGSVWTLRPEVFYMQRGAKRFIDNDVDEGFAVKSRKLHGVGHYVGVGFLNKFRVSGEALDFYTLIGPQIAYAVYGRTIDSEYDRSTANTTTRKANLDFDAANLSRWDANLRIGAGVSTRIANRIALMEITYDAGFLDVDKSATEAINRKNFQVSIGFGLNRVVGRKS